MPNQFNKLGIAFQYPENWTLDEQDALAGNRSVTVHSPGGAFWSVSVHPRWANPLRLARAVADTMRDEYKDLETEETEETIAGRTLVGYDLNFFYLDFTNTATIRCLRTLRGTYAFFCQGEDREFDQVRHVFLAMTTSLLENLKRLGWLD
ncbi:MAG: hypothetical protein ACUVUC_12945 [Thermoguttaceae bacterium]